MPRNWRNWQRCSVPSRTRLGTPGAPGQALTTGGPPALSARGGDCTSPRELGWAACLGRILSSAAILAKQNAEWLRTGRTRGRQSVRVPSRVSHHQHWTGSRMSSTPAHWTPVPTLTPQGEPAQNRARTDVHFRPGRAEQRRGGREFSTRWCEDAPRVPVRPDRPSRSTRYPRGVLHKKPHKGVRIGRRIGRRPWCSACARRAAQHLIQRT